MAHTWDKISPLPVGKKVLILGSGIIGNLMGCLLHLQGHKNVTVAEPSQSRLELTKRLGNFNITPDHILDRCANLIHRLATNEVVLSSGGDTGNIIDINTRRVVLCLRIFAT